MLTGEKPDMAEEPAVAAFGNQRDREIAGRTQAIDDRAFGAGRVRGMAESRVDDSGDRSLVAQPLVADNPLAHSNR